MIHKTSDTSHFEKHISVVTSDKTAIALLAEHTTITIQQLKKTMTNGAVWLESSIGTHRIRRAKKTLAANDTLHIYYDETIQNSRPESAKLIADEGDYSIWNKPYGMYSQGTKWGDHCTIYRWAEKHLQPQRPAFLVHRLDRAASGLIIIAHSKKMATKFSALFESHLITKQYRATVEGRLNGIELPHTINSEIEGKPSISIITAVEQIDDDKARVTIEIETGRKHQIRQHLSKLGFPIIGDRLYGSGLYGSGKSVKDLQLKSCYLKFNCPITNVMREYSL